MPDEPTSALDVSSQRQLTYLMVSHNLAVVGHLCDEVAVIQNRELVEKLRIVDLRALRPTRNIPSSDYIALWAMCVMRCMLREP